jgi:hypothetical protein
MERLLKKDSEKFLNLSRGNIDWFRSNNVEYLLGNSFIYGLTYSQPDNKKNLIELDNYYIYGGIGKTSSVRYLYPNAYYKNNNSWLGYYNLNIDHELVVFDNVDNLETFINIFDGLSNYKTIAGHYPFMVVQNSRNLYIRPKKIIIISNVHPGELFKSVCNNEEFLKMFYRYFKIEHISEWLNNHNIYFDKNLNRIVHMSINNEKENKEKNLMAIEDSISECNNRSLNIHNHVIDDYHILK